MRKPLTPDEFRRGQLKLLSQASGLDKFVSRKQHAGQQQQARTVWLLAQQRLDQEAADCSADLAGWLAGPALQAAQLLIDEFDVDASYCGSTRLQGRGGLNSENSCTADCLLLHPLPLTTSGSGISSVAEAAALATAVAGLLADSSGTGVRTGPAPLLALQQRLAALQQQLADELATADAAITQALRQAQLQFAAASRPPGASSKHADDGTCGSGGSRMQNQVQLVCEQHPLAAGEYKQQLLEQAEEVGTRHRQQQQQRRAAWQAFRATTQQQQQQQTQVGGSWPAGGVAATLAADSRPGSSASSTGTSSSSRLSDCSRLAWEADAEGLHHIRTADGWSPDEHAVLLHERRASLAPGGGGEPGLLCQLAAMLPTRTSQQVQQHVQWHKEAGRLHSAAQQADASWRQEEAAFLAASAALLAEADSASLAAAQVALSQLEAVAACFLSADALDQWQAARQEAKAAAAPLLVDAAMALAGRQAVQRQAAEQYRRRMKQLLQQHQERQEEQAAGACAAEHAAAAAAAREAAAAAVTNKQRVQHRQQQGAARESSRQQQQAARQQEQQRRQEALEQLRRQVAPAAQRDPQRARGATHSSSAAAAAAEKPHGLFAQALGFTTDQLLQDQRFKVYEALRHMGLHTTVAGRQAVAGACPARQLRADTLTSGQREGGASHGARLA